MRIKRPCPISCIRPRLCLRDLTITIYILPSSSKLSSSSSPPPSSSSPSSFALSSFLQIDGFTHLNASFLYYVLINHNFYRPLSSHMGILRPCSIRCIRPPLFFVASANIISRINNESTGIWFPSLRHLNVSTLATRLKKRATDW